MNAEVKETSSGMFFNNNCYARDGQDVTRINKN